MNHFFAKKSKAQGILEVVIAIYIAVVGILSIMNLVFSSIRVERLNHNMLIATNLAREGIEVARNIRDSNWVGGREWNIGLLSNGGLERSFIINNNYLAIDQNGYSLAPIGIGWNECIQQGESSPCRVFLVWRRDEDLNPNKRKMYVQNLEIIDNTGSYERSSTNFYRMIYIYDICSRDLDGFENINKSLDRNCDVMFTGTSEIGMWIISIVGWQDGDSMKTIRASERIYNWK